MDPEIAEIYNKSKAVSTSQGSSFNLMKASAKRRRSKKQIEEEKKQEELRKAEVERMCQEHADMKAKLDVLKDNADDLENAGKFIGQLRDAGLVYSDARGEL